MFVTLISLCGTFKSFGDLTEVSAQSWYKVRTYNLVNPPFKISLFIRQFANQISFNDSEKLFASLQSILA